jgi:CDP-glucose 4,6-dehydratase
MAAHRKSIVSVRAGNVIGGGDYADNRIIPDIIRSLENNEEIVLRNPKSTRPWQHVLEPLAIYLDLAMHMFKEPDKWNEAFNIGPDKSDVWTVEDLAKEAIAVAGKGRLRIEQNPDAPHEAALLMLDNQKIKDKLDWKPRMNAREAIGASIQWYLEDEDASTRCLKQIKSFFDDEIQDAEHD